MSNLLLDLDAWRECLPETSQDAHAAEDSKELIFSRFHLEPVGEGQGQLQLLHKLLHLSWSERILTGRQAHYRGIDVAQKRVKGSPHTLVKQARGVTEDQLHQTPLLDGSLTRCFYLMRLKVAMDEVPTDVVLSIFHTYIADIGFVYPLTYIDMFLRFVK